MRQIEADGGELNYTTADWKGASPVALPLAGLADGSGLASREAP
jgi:hypothetical protein